MAMYDSITEAIKNKEAVTKLKLGWMNKTHVNDFVEHIGDFKNLEELEMGSFHEKELPAVIYKLPKLKKLEIRYARHFLLSKEIEQLQQLEFVHLQFGTFHSLPESMKNLSKLKHLFFSSLLVDTSQLHWIGELSGLESLALKTSYQKDYFKNMSFVHQLQNLKTLSLSCNYLNYRFQSPSLEFDDSFFEPLDQLKVLELKACGLSKFNKSWANLKVLEKLDLTGNKFSRFPLEFLDLPKLKTIKLAENEIKNSAAIEELFEALPVGNKQAYQVFFNYLNTKKETPKATKQLLFDACGINGAKKLRVIALEDIHERYKSNELSQLKAGDQLSLVGAFGCSVQRLEEMQSILNEHNINIKTKATEKQTHWTLGDQGHAQKDITVGDIVLMSEVDLIQLTQYLNPNAYLAKEDENMLTRIRTLLFHTAIENVLLAIEMLKGGGVPDSLLTELCFVLLGHPNEEVKLSAKEVLTDVLSAKEKEIVFWGYDSRSTAQYFSYADYKRTKEIIDNILEAPCRIHAGLLSFYLYKYGKGFSNYTNMYIYALEHSQGPVRQYILSQSLEKGSLSFEKIKIGKVIKNAGLIEDIKELKEVKKLDLTDCGIEVFPKELASLQQLESLNLDSNKCTSNAAHPKHNKYCQEQMRGLLGMPNLKELEVSRRTNFNFPKAIFCIPHLKRLTITVYKQYSSYRYREMATPKIKHKRLPKAVLGLKQVEYLHLNILAPFQLENLELLVQMPNLKELSFENYAALKILPKEFEKFSQLRILNLKGTKIENKEYWIDVLPHCEVLVD
ncbi:MAG: leucine-rich repeat domain-containing protein [Aureispira sp.]|nr:leucine-rich repeat domain-containing protein [Aureispira sp.]